MKGVRIIATTGIWKIEKRLDHVIDYTTNIEKTLNSDYGKEAYYELHNLDEYAEADFKTEKQYYVSALNCCVESAYEEMQLTKKQYGKTGGILGFHAFQSFKEGEVTPEQAHAIGVKLAQEMWGDRFEVIVSTHLNTKHYHNHFVINSVSFKDGKRYYDKRETYARLRQLSDSLCEEYGLSVLEEKPCRNSKINYANYYKGYVEKNNYYTTTKEDVDRAIAQAYSYKDFECLMKAMDYELIYRGSRLSVRRDPYKKHIRIERSFGYDYSIDRIKERIEVEQAPRVPFIEEYGNKKRPKTYTPFKKQKHTGLYALYLHYCYLLKVFPTEYPNKRLSPEIRADLKELDKISKQTELLVSNKLDTYEQFFAFKTQKTKELDSLLDKRSKLWYKHKKSKNPSEKESIRNEIDLLNKEINPLREEVVLCDGIEERTPKMEQNVSDFEEKKDKEVKNNELIK